MIFFCIREKFERKCLRMIFVSQGRGFSGLSSDTQLNLSIDLQMRSPVIEL